MDFTCKSFFRVVRHSIWKSQTFLFGTLTGSILLTIELWFWLFRTGDLFRGAYFESTSSEEMMQTLELNFLIDHPIRSFWYLHFQPPGFDFLRLVLALPEVIFGSRPSLETLDLRIYLVHIVMFGAMNAIIFYWVRAMSGSPAIALVTSVIWAAYPGNIAMVTYLDSMYLSSFLLMVCAHLWFMYLRLRRLGFALSACFVGITLTLTRTSLQPVLFAAIVIVGYFIVRQTAGTRMRKKAAGWFLTCLLLSIAYPLKQFVLFGTFSSTSSGGHHLLGMIRYLPTEQEFAKVAVPSRVVNNANKLVNAYNVPEEAITNFRYSQIFLGRIIEEPVISLRETLVSAQRSIVKGAGATQAYQQNVLVDLLPWSRFSESLFSGSSYVLFIGLGSVLLLVLRLKDLSLSWRRLLIETAPVIAVLAVLTFTIFFGSLRYTTAAEMGAPFGWIDGFSWTESNRLKFHLEVFVLPAAVFGTLSAAQLVYRQWLRPKWSVS